MTSYDNLQATSVMDADQHPDNSHKFLARFDADTGPTAMGDSGPPLAISKSYQGISADPNDESGVRAMRRNVLPGYFDPGMK